MNFTHTLLVSVLFLYIGCRSPLLFYRPDKSILFRFGMLLLFVYAMLCVCVYIIERVLYNILSFISIHILEKDNIDVCVFLYVYIK